MYRIGFPFYMFNFIKHLNTNYYLDILSECIPQRQCQVRKWSFQFTLHFTAVLRNRKIGKGIYARVLFRRAGSAIADFKAKPIRCRRLTFRYCLYRITRGIDVGLRFRGFRLLATAARKSYLYWLQLMWRYVDFHGLSFSISSRRH